MYLAIISCHKILVDQHFFLCDMEIFFSKSCTWKRRSIEQHCEIEINLKYENFLYVEYQYRGRRHGVICQG